MDKSELQALLEDAEVYEEADYTEASYGALTNAIAAGESVMANEEATQIEVNQAIITLTLAIEGLLLVPYIAYEFDFSLGEGYVNIQNSDLAGQEILVFEGLYEDNLSRINKGFKDPDTILTDLKYNTKLSEQLGLVYTMSAKGAPGAIETTVSQINTDKVLGFKEYELGKLNNNKIDMPGGSSGLISGPNVGSGLISGPGGNIGGVIDKNEHKEDEVIYITLDAPEESNTKYTVIAKKMTRTGGNVISAGLVGLPHFDIGRLMVTDMSNMFRATSSLEVLDVSDWDVSNVTNMSNMFQNASALVELDVTDWDVSNVTNIAYLFNGTKSLSTLDVSNWEISGAKDMRSVFQDTSLTSLDLSRWDVSSAINMTRLFSNNDHLHTITGLEDWDVSKVTGMNDMFMFDGQLTHANVSGWNVAHIETEPSRFAFSTPNWPEEQHPVWGTTGKWELVDGEWVIKDD